ncbi:tryptophan halogenase family protein [Neptunicella sp. SCSIO 80796]|uniref:tryptophan halogenase family protein n=1 Tax=Neptunicella plasticusilytica TaxID=3117012 RepID=UPI003A4E2578
MQQQRKFKILIVGGGTAGWMTAASLSKHYGKQADICLIESSDIPAVGVGEATIPTIRHFYQGLGISDQEVISTAEATCKLGIEFNGWNRDGECFFHPFGVFGQSMAGVEFHHYWLKRQRAGDTDNFWEYSLATQMAKSDRFALPAEHPRTELSVFDWALHIDAGLFAGLMKRKALANGVEHIDGLVDKVRLRDDGDIDNVLLCNGQIVYADLFVDCSGFNGLLIEQALHTGYQNWQQWLLCDSAWVLQSQSQQPLSPYTKVTAEDAGWRWNIPLQHRMGQGHVYSSQYMTEESALDTLLQQAGSSIVKDPRRLEFVPGRRNKAWHKNCVAIGLSAGFLEPLESTSIALIQTGIERLVASLTSFNIHQSVKDEFNHTTEQEYCRVRDFIILHYKLNNRPAQQAFWRYCRDMALPQELQHKLDLYQASGYLVNYRWEIFHQPSWLAILFGFDCYPQSYDQRTDSLVDQSTLLNVMDKMKGNISKSLDKTIPHHDFIRQHCRT